MDEFPKMLYRFPAQGINTHALQDGSYDTLIVGSLTDEERLVTEGWRLTSADARQADVDAKVAAALATQQAFDAGTPTRAELEQKATELGVKFDGRTSDKALADRIRAQLET